MRTITRIAQNGHLQANAKRTHGCSKIVGPVATRASDAANCAACALSLAAKKMTNAGEKIAGATAAGVIAMVGIDGDGGEAIAAVLRQFFAFLMTYAYSSMDDV